MNFITISLLVTLFWVRSSNQIGEGEEEALKLIQSYNIDYISEIKE